MICIFFKARIFCSRRCRNLCTNARHRFADIKNFQRYLTVFHNEFATRRVKSAASGEIYSALSFPNDNFVSRNHRAATLPPSKCLFAGNYERYTARVGLIVGGAIEAERQLLLMAQTSSKLKVGSHGYVLSVSLPPSPSFLQPSRHSTLARPSV